MREPIFLRVKNSLLELELKDREVKIKREKEELFLKQLLCL